tara:strand:- start:2330 stop:3763 length:1434 start_codon:yes stop_codon:yes gene_type:complete
MKKILTYTLGVFVLLLMFMTLKTLLFSNQQTQYEPITPIEVSSTAIGRFQKALQYKTISYQYPGKPDSTEFKGLHDHLSKSFPLIDSLLEKKTIDFSLLYKWEGTDQVEKPILLMSHIDVVPVDQSTFEDWEAGPFSGKIIDGNIYGRGTMDDKVSVLSIMESVEMLLRDGFKPKRTIYFAFGHDEEIGGDNGAGAIGKFLEAEGVSLEFVMDEGGSIVDELIPGVEKSLALINVAEKGYVTYELTITTDGGHSSRPNEDNTIGSLARAIVKLENSQLPYKSIPVLEKQIATIGPELPFMEKFVFSNSWLFKNQILKGFNAHTTTAATIISGGVKDNVIPTQATATVNFRVMTGETTSSIKEHIEKTIDDKRIEVVAVRNINEPSAVSDYNSKGYSIIEKTIKQLNPNIIVSPGLISGGTDTKHYSNISENAYRFIPLRVNESNLTGFHGINEHIPVENYLEMVQFYYQFFQNINQN